MATLKELMAKQSPDSQQRIAAKAAEIRQSVALNLLREELQMSQTEMAAAMGVKQPTIAKMEQADNCLLYTSPSPRDQRGESKAE
ncbi:XRE family transcriptional regulator [Klebsiella pneumoniae]|nr:helix-turn-helix domain-containing protein [Klebsiella pneumoniae]RFC99640.1 XRE family transcriptional regulator [Klebsiella pneumoniae]